MDISNIKTVLIITGPGIGDGILSVPLFKTVRENIPHAKIDSMQWIDTRSVSKEILKKFCKIDNFKEVSWMWNSIKKWANLAVILAKQYDLVIDAYPGSDKTALFAHYAGKYSAGFRFNKKNYNLYDISIDPKKKNKVLAEAELLRKIGFEVKEPSLEKMTNNKKYGKEVGVFFKKNKIKKSIGVIFPRDLDIIRAWDNKKWVQILNKIMKKYKSDIIFIGSNLNKKRIKEIRSQLKNQEKTHVFSKENLEEVATFIEKLDLVLSENSGIMHLATTTNVPLIALCGPSFYGWGPFGRNSTEIRPRPHAGGPCDSKPCKKGCKTVMKKIQVRQVWKEIVKKLGK